VKGNPKRVPRPSFSLKEVRGIMHGANLVKNGVLLPEALTGA